MAVCLLAVHSLGSTCVIAPRIVQSLKLQLLLPPRRPLLPGPLWRQHACATFLPPAVLRQTLGDTGLTRSSKTRPLRAAGSGMASPTVAIVAAASTAAAAAPRGFGDAVVPKKRSVAKTKATAATLKVAKAPKGCRVFELRARDGSRWQLLLGKSAEDNDRLSFAVGLPHESWMHVAGMAGSHAVVRHVRHVSAAPEKGADSARKGQRTDPVPPRPPSDVLTKAASICAFHSKARAKSSVEVHITTCGRLSKPPGAPAGMVQLKGGYQTLSVRPLDPTSLESC